MGFLIKSYDGYAGDTQALIELIKNYGGVKKGEFTLSSGKKSDVYFDIKEVMTHPDFLKAYVNRMTKMYDLFDYDAFAGVELGGVPLAVALSISTGKPYLIIRKDEKRHGLGGRIIGDVRGQSVLVLEDVVTSGKSLLSVLKACEDAGLKVGGAVAVVDRSGGQIELTNEFGSYPFSKLLTPADFLE